jgi:uncharacterized protein YgiM (DUF1202 family)
MHRARVRHAFSVVSVIALLGLVAACAQPAPPPPPPPPPPAPMAAPPPPPPPPAAEAAAYTVTAHIWLHAGPSVRTRRIAALKPGEPVHGTGKATRYWRQVTTPGGATGWALSRYLKPE